MGPAPGLRRAGRGRVRTYSALATSASARPDVEQHLAQPVQPGHREEERAHHRRDGEPPGPVDAQLDAVRAGRSGRARASTSSRAASTASAQRGSSWKRQVTTTPADHQQAVGDRVHQRAQAAVLAGQARGDPVGVVAPADHARTASPPARLPVAGWTARRPGTRGSAPGARSRSRWGASTAAAARRPASAAAAARSGPARTAARSSAAASRSRARAGSRSDSRGGSATARPRPAASAAGSPSSGSPGACLRPRRTCTSISPDSSERRPTVSRSGQPSSSASANFSPGPMSRSS